MFKLCILATCFLAACAQQLRYAHYDLDGVLYNNQIFKQVYGQCSTERRHCYSNNNMFSVSEIIPGTAWNGPPPLAPTALGVENCEYMLRTACGRRYDGPCGSVDNRIEFCRTIHPTPYSEANAQALPAYQSYNNYEPKPSSDPKATPLPAFNSYGAAKPSQTANGGLRPAANEPNSKKKTTPSPPFVHSYDNNYYDPKPSSKAKITRPAFHSYDEQKPSKTVKAGLLPAGDEEEEEE